MNMRLFFLLLIALPILTNAYSVQSVDNLLAGYNVSSTTISKLTFDNISYTSSNYTALSYNGQITFLVNVTKQPYSLILNSSQIGKILHTQLISQGLSSVNFQQLVKQMDAFQNSSTSTLNSCIQITGTNRGSCTLSNYCQSCSLVPSCNKALVQTGGPDGPLGYGIVGFQSELTNLTDEYLAFSQAALTINGSNANQNIQVLVNAFDNISSGSMSLAQNPIFPPPLNADFSLCGGFGNSASSVPTQSGPWYCNSVGYCDSLNYNYSALTAMQTTITQIQGLPFTNAQINQISQNISNTEEGYVGPVLLAEKHQQLKVALNKTLAGYTTLIIAANALQTHISNASLAARQAAIMQNYTNLLNNYLNVNISVAAANLSTQLVAFNSIYNKANSSYSNLVAIAKNNSAILLQIQLNTKNPSMQSSDLDFQQIALNSKLESSINNTTALNANLLAINKQASSILGSTFEDPLVTLTRDVDGPFVRVVLGAMNLPYATAVGSAPAISLIPAVIIGVVILLLLFMWYSGLKGKHKLRVDHRTKKNWNRLFMIAIALFVVYLLITFSLASSANSFAPASTFQGAIANSKTIVIALNGTATTPMLSCQSQIESAAVGLGKNTTSIRIDNSTCIVNGTPEALAACMNPYAEKNTPVVILTQSNSTHIGVYSYYGTVLNARGNSSFMTSCPVSILIR